MNVQCCSIGNITRNCNLLQSEPPSVFIEPTEAVVSAGDDVTFACHTDTPDSVTLTFISGSRGTIQGDFNSTVGYNIDTCHVHTLHDLLTRKYSTVTL